MFLLFLVTEPPNRQKLAFRSLCLLTLLPVVLVIIVLLILFILPDHPLHDLHASLERGGVPSSLSTSGLLFFLLVAALLIILSFLLELFNIGIPDLPLGHFSSEVISDRWASGSSSFFDRRVNGLDLSALVIELIPHRLFDSLHILAGSRLFLFGLPLDLLKLGLPDILNLLLDLILIGRSMDVISLKAEMHDQLINSIIYLVLPVEVIIHDPVGFRLGVRHHEGPRDCEVQLSRRQSGIFWDFLKNEKDVTCASSSSYSLTTLTSACTISAFFEPFFWGKEGRYVADGVLGGDCLLQTWSCWTHSLNQFR